jgi:hypothetical protein
MGLEYQVFVTFSNGSMTGYGRRPAEITRHGDKQRADAAKSRQLPGGTSPSVPETTGF